MTTINTLSRTAQPSAHLIKPRYYPHHGMRVYTPLGFRRRVRKRLLLRGFKPHEVRRLEELYFGRNLHRYLDERATYRNLRKYRLYRMSRQLHADRKRPIFEIVLRSNLFFCFVDDANNIVGFTSPYCLRAMGIIPFTTL